MTNDERIEKRYLTLKAGKIYEKSEQLGFIIHSKTGKNSRFLHKERLDFYKNHIAFTQRKLRNFPSHDKGINKINFIRDKINHKSKIIIDPNQELKRKSPTNRKSENFFTKSLHSSNSKINPIKESPNNLFRNLNLIEYTSNRDKNKYFLTNELNLKLNKLLKNYRNLKINGHRMKFPKICSNIYYLGSKTNQFHFNRTQKFPSIELLFNNLFKIEERRFSLPSTKIYNLTLNQKSKSVYLSNISNIKKVKESNKNIKTERNIEPRNANQYLINRQIHASHLKMNTHPKISTNLIPFSQLNFPKLVNNGKSISEEIQTE